MALGAIGLVVTLITTAASAYMQHEDAAGIEDQAELNAKREREAAEAAAENERITRQAEAREESREAAERKAKFRAQVAVSGVEMSGTPQLLLEEQAALDDMNIQQRDSDSLSRRTSLKTHGNRQYARGMAVAGAQGKRKNRSLITGTLNTGAAGVSYSNQRGWLD